MSRMFLAMPTTRQLSSVSRPGRPGWGLSLRTCGTCPTAMGGTWLPRGVLASARPAACLAEEGVELGWREEGCVGAEDTGRVSALLPSRGSRVALFHPARLAHLQAGGFVRLEIAFFN